MTNPGYTIANGANVPLNVQQGTTPNMGVALLDYFQLMTFTQIVKTVVAFQLIETPTNITFWGIIQPLQGRQLQMKPEGQRSWNWTSVYAQAGPVGSVLSLLPDEIIIYLGRQYRVMTARSYAIYGYVYYELVEDYSGSGPPTP
jgi:hypothetical protein